MKKTIEQRLIDEVLIFDGAMGTEIYNKNFFIDKCFEELNLSAPKKIAEIHASYYNAGADVLTTNSFGANKNKLSRFGLANKVKEINIAAVELVRENCGEETLIAGSVGPIGDISYNSTISDEEKIEIQTEQIAALEEGGADFIIFETLRTHEDITYALKAINSGSKLPYIVSIAVTRECETSRGEPIAKLLNIISSFEKKPVAIGLNCGIGPEPMLSAIEILVPICEFPIIIQPNAGEPRNINNRTFYMASPEYFTTFAIRFMNLGARGLGGCCGTGPDHIEDLSRSIRSLSKTTFHSKVETSILEEIGQEPVLLAEKSEFGKKLAAGEWIKSIEIVPPRGYDLSQTIEKAKKCKKAGIDAINIPDGPRASCRISPIITSLYIQKEANIETILHFCCRDRNLIGMQSDLLGCAASDIKNMLFVTGDPPKLGDYPYASAVFDADSIGMARVQSQLNRGIDLGGSAITKKTEAVIGVGADPNAIDYDREIDRIKQKIDSGAEFIMTQPVFEAKSLFKFLDTISNFNIPILAGIWPLASYRNAEFMRNEVPGVVVPDSAMELMAKASTKEEQRETGISIARKCIAEISGRIQGVQVSAPFGNVDTAIAVLM